MEGKNIIKIPSLEYKDLSNDLIEILKNSDKWIINPIEKKNRNN